MAHTRVRRLSHLSPLTTLHGRCCPCSHRPSEGHRQAALTLAGLVGAVGISPGSSPLQGLINCLKEILVPGPQHPEVSPRSLPPVPGRDASRLTRAELGPGSPPWGGESPGDLSPQVKVSEAPKLPFGSSFSEQQCLPKGSFPTWLLQYPQCPRSGPGGFLGRTAFGQLVGGNSKTDSALDPRVFFHPS